MAISGHDVAGQLWDTSNVNETKSRREMESQVASDLVREALIQALIIGSPILLVGMAVGLLIGLVQALTQIQDQTVSFVPKILAMATATVVCLPWLIQRMVEFARQVYIDAAYIGP